MADVLGLEFPFFTAGAGGVLASVLYANGPTARRDGAIRDGGTCGFWLGALFYAIAFFNQVTSAR